MIFQFYCPQGHLLQADSSHSGSIIVCPVCGVQFIIPAAPMQAVQAAQVTPAAPVSPAQPSSASSAFSAASDSSDSLENSLEFGTRTRTRKRAASNLNFDSLESEEPEKKPAGPSLKEQMKQKSQRRETQELLSAATKAPKKAEELAVLHIPCPKGHLLDVDKEMLGERVQCPVCHAVYDLKLENSLEYIQEKKKAEELEELRLGKIWIVRAIIAVVLLILFLGLVCFI